MNKKILCIVESAYRGTLEEQDDSIMWLTQAIGKAGGQMSVVLRGNAVNYAVKAQNPSGVTIGKLAIERPIDPTADIARMKQAGIAVYLVKEDLDKRGIGQQALIGDVELLGQRDLAGMFAGFDHVWHW
jgi:sulfur relay (sulfurtransferase) DsrF/TusC family protein